MKTSRSNFFKTNMVDGIAERDLINVAFNDYTFKYDFTKYRLQYNDYMRPDLISLKFYGTSDYWWIILKCNPSIEDIWNDVAIEDEQEEKYPEAITLLEYINIPAKQDIDDFIAFSKNYN